jgi:hypothetical protein
MRDLKGDLNGDGKLDSKDLVLLAQRLNSLQSDPP